MRDYVLTAFILGTIPFILVRPWIGVLVWTWIGLMNPHRLTWNFAFSMPFAMIIAIATFAGILFTKEKLRIPMKSPVVLLMLLTIWVSITTYFAMNPGPASFIWEKVMKIMLMTFVTLMLITDRKRLFALVAVICVSLGFYGFKGGIFTATTGGISHVLGPPGSFIEGNTEIGLAMIMALPLMRAIQLNVTSKALRYGIGVTMGLTALAILGTQSRGAFLGAAAMAVMLFFKSRHKLLMGGALALLIPLFLVMMPASWFQRMDTISTYEQDGSAMGRIYAWEFATRMAIARPLGGGYESFTPENYVIYLPDRPQAINNRGDVADAHSIYFQMLGLHGFVGLALFVALLFATWRTASRTMAATRGSDDDKWSYDLAAMCQVSLIGYMVAGAFLGLANFDLLYTLVAVVVINHVLAVRPGVVVRAHASAKVLEAAPVRH